MPRFDLSRRVLLAYGAPGLPLAALTLPVYILLPTFYATTLGLGLASVGLALVVARIWDALSDPLIGYLSDQTRNQRFGRRMPWIIGGMVPVMLGTWQLLMPPDDAGLAHLMMWSVILYTGWTAMILPLSAMGAEISENYHERSRIAGFREGAVLVGTLLALSLAAAFGAGEPERAGEALQAIAIAVLVSLPLATLVLWRGIGTPAMLARMSAPPASGLSLKERLKAVLGNRPFRRLMTAFLINAMANGLPATLFVLYVENVLQRPDLTGPLLFGYFLASIVAVPLWLQLSYRIGKHRAWCLAMALSCLFFIPAPFLGPGDLYWFIFVVLATGLCLGADLTLPSSMQADVVDVDTAQTGERRAGLFFAAWSMANKLALALAVGITFPILELAGFNSGASAGEQTAFSMMVLAGLYGFAPIMIKIISIIMIWKHPLTEQELKTVQRAQADDPTGSRT